MTTVLTNWQRHRLGEVSEIATGFPFKSERYSNTAADPRLLRGDNIVQGALRWEDAKRWPANAVEGLNSYWLCAGDVVLAMDRPWIEAGLKFACLAAADLPALLVQRVARLRGSALIDTAFLRYVIASQAFTDHVLAVQTGTAVPHISAGQIKSFEFCAPSIAAQRSIANVLHSLDDKIELNRRMSQTLEAIAQAIFKSWFVDIGAESVPLTTMKELTTKIGSGATPRGGREVYVNEGIALVRSQNVYDSEFMWDGLARITDDAARQLANVELRAGDVLLNITGASILRTCVVPPEVLPARVNQHVAIVRAKPGVSPHYLHLHLLQPDTKAYLLGLNAGGSREAVTKSHIESVPIPDPGPEALARFHAAIAPLYVQSEACAAESRVLATLRDALLPKLLSGELELKQPEAIA